MATKYPGDFLEGQSNKLNEKVREATALPKLEDIFRCRRLRWLGHLSRMDHLDFRDKLSYGNPRVSGGGQLRRPRQNWKDVKRDLRKMGISWDEVEEAAEDRSLELEESCRPMRL